MAIRYAATNRKPARVEYEGAVLSISRNDNHRLMSDIWGTALHATVWDEAKGRPVSFIYAYPGFELATDNGEAEVDATDEVKAKVDAYYEGLARGRAFAYAEGEEARKAAAAEKKARVEAKRKEIEAKRDAIERTVPKVGDTIEVTRGNGSTPKGTTGKVFWAGWSKRHDASWRIGFKTEADETHWIAATGVKLIERGDGPDDGGGKGGKKDEPVEAAEPGYEPERGDTVEVARGRGAGAVGEIIWVGSDKYTGAPRVGVKDKYGEVTWTAAANVRSWTRRAA